MSCVKLSLFLALLAKKTMSFSILLELRLKSIYKIISVTKYASVNLEISSMGLLEI